MIQKAVLAAKSDFIMFSAKHSFTNQMRVSSRKNHQKSGLCFQIEKRCFFGWGVLKHIWFCVVGYVVLYVFVV